MQQFLCCCICFSHCPSFFSLSLLAFSSSFCLHCLVNTLKLPDFAISTSAEDCSVISFYRAMLCIRGTSRGPVSVCLCLSVTSRSSAKTAKQRITQTTPHDSPGTHLSFVMPKISAKFDRVHPLRGRRMQVGWVRIGDF